MHFTLKTFYIDKILVKAINYQYFQLFNYLINIKLI